MLTPVGPHLGMSTFYSPRLLSFCIRAIFTPILVKFILIKHNSYLISKHLVFCVWLCLVSLQVKTQLPVILLYVHGYRELSYYSCILINKQAHLILSLFSWTTSETNYGNPSFSENKIDSEGHVLILLRIQGSLRTPESTIGAQGWKTVKGDPLPPGH